MRLRAPVMAACAILAAFAAGACFAVPAAPALTSFGALSSRDLAALALHAPDTARSLSGQPSGFASSLPLTPTFALDGGYRIDIASRFASFEQVLSPLRDTGSFLSLANGGRYAGITYVPTSHLDVRLGASNWTGRLDDISMDGAAIGLPAVYDTAHVNSVLAGVTWNFNEWAAVGLNTIASFRDGTPLGYQGLAPLTESAATQGLQITARLNFGSNWSTTAQFGQGLTQLRQQGGAVTSLDAQTFAITVAKRGVFGDDALGISLSRPAPGLAGTFGSLVDSTGELPAVALAATAARAPETDFQLGYVTSFLGGRLALQTNAAYQVNPQGQEGASAVSVIQRAKIKF
jgi:hypothetical protein